MPFELVGHTADIGIQGSGETLGEAFGAVADGMAAAQCETIPEDSGEEFSFELEAENVEALLFDFLDRLIYERDVQHVLPTNHSVSVARRTDGWRVRATARGVPLEGLHAREIKAVTYSEMEIEETKDGWRVYVVLDV
jgi:SHS2 domain-containing protein